MLPTRKTHRDHGTLWCNGTVRHAGIALRFPCLPILFPFSLLLSSSNFLRILFHGIICPYFFSLFHFRFFGCVLRSLFEIFLSFFPYVWFLLLFMRCKVDILLRIFLMHTWKCLSCVIFFFFVFAFVRLFKESNNYFEINAMFNTFPKILRKVCLRKQVTLHRSKSVCCCC